MSYLEDQWKKILRGIRALRAYPFIDDQTEITDAWDLTREIISSGKLANEDISVKKIITESGASKQKSIWS